MRRRWRQVQYLADQFWLRWRKEYLQTLQIRQKWPDVEPNFTVDNLVLVSDENSTRGKWSLGRVVQTFPDKLGHVRQVLVRTQNSRQMNEDCICVVFIFVCIRVSTCRILCLNFFSTFVNCGEVCYGKYHFEFSTRVCFCLLICFIISRRSLADLLLP